MRHDHSAASAEQLFIFHNISHLFSGKTGSVSQLVVVGPANEYTKTGKLLANTNALNSQLLPLAPPRTGRCWRLRLAVQRHARCGGGVDLHIEGLVVAHLDSARALPPPARCALLFCRSVGCCAHLVPSIVPNSFTCSFVRMRRGGHLSSCYPSLSRVLLFDASIPKTWFHSS